MRHDRRKVAGHQDDMMRASSLLLAAVAAAAACDATGPTNAPVWAQVSTGRLHSCAVTVAQRAYCWGLNTNGAMGDGSTERRSAPGEPVPVLPPLSP
ncbi:MAG: hypothetical protein ACREJ4_03580 [Candidatus Methylomirabilaceae bacterium]